MSGPRIGLALGGGSARGLAHIPMLEVFDELGIKPSIIAGCSIGALIGAGYAAGMSAKDIRERAEMLLGHPVGAMRYVMGRAGIFELLAMRSFRSMHIQGETLAGLVLPDTLPRLIEDFPIPFRVIATDFDAMAERVIDSGPAVKAVAASIAIPGVILGPEIDGHTFVDGGITNPLPFDLIRDACDIVVAIDVTGRPRPTARRHRSNMELAIGSLLIMFHQVAALKRSAGAPDIYVEPMLTDFSAGDFFRFNEVLTAAQPAKDQLKVALDRAINGRG